MTEESTRHMESWSELALAEANRFIEEYETHYLEEETKPRDIGGPIFYRRKQAKIGVLLIHGFMAAPEEVREWAESLYQAGYTVYAPRLSGHGTSAEDLSTRSYGQWNESVHRGHGILKGCCDTIVVAGFSTGAGLALAQALAKPEAFAAVVSVSAPLKFKGRSAALIETLNHWNRFFGFFRLRFLTKRFVTNHADNPHINYLRSPISGLTQVKALMRIVWKELPRLAPPALIVQGVGDPKVKDTSGKKLVNRIRHDNKLYLEIPFHLHGIVRGEVALELFEEVNRFIETVCNAPDE